jgi:hypothetical protein
MNRFHFVFLFMGLITLSGNLIYGQVKVPEALEQRLQGKQNYWDIKAEIDAYYGGGQNLSESDFKNYRNLHRMMYWAEKRLTPEKTIGDFATMNQLALKQVEAIHGPEMEKSRQLWYQFKQQHQQDLENDQSLMNLEANAEQLSAYGNWTQIFIGSGGTMGNNADIQGVGRLDRIAFHPSNSNILFVGSPSGGLWRVTLNSTQTGASWTCISDNLPAIGISGIAVHPSNANIIYVSTGDGDSNMPGYFVANFGYAANSQGVYKTTDGGASWVRTGDMPSIGDAYTIHKLTMSYSNGNYLFAATSNGLYRTTNGGNSWERVRTGRHRDVKFRPGSDSTIYTSTNTTVARSIQGGRLDTWTASTFSHSVSNARRIELAVRRNSTNSGSTYVYALAGRGFSTGTFVGLFRSTDNGQNFSRMSNSPNILCQSITGGNTDCDSDQSDYDLCMTVKPNAVNTLATGALIMWRSTDGGTTMVNSSTYREGQGDASEYVHPDIHDLAYQTGTNFLFSANDGGLSISKDDGVTWTDLSSGMNTSQIYRFKMRDPDGNGYSNSISLLGGLQDNGVKFRNGSGGFTHAVCCDGFDGVISGKDANRIWFTFNDRFRTSSNGGVNTSSVFNPSGFFRPLAMDWNNPDTMYLGDGTNLRRTYDAWANRTAFSFDCSRVLSTAPSNSSRIYGSGGTQLRVSDDRGATFKNLHTLAGYPSGSPTITDIKPSPTNSGTIYVTFGGYAAANKVLQVSGVFNDNPVIANITANLPNVAIFCVFPASEGIYIGTDIGVFFRPAGRSQWQPFYNGLPMVPVSGIWVNEANNNVYISTFGRGFWFSSRKSACLASITLSNQIAGQYYYQASETITSSQQTDGTVGTLLNLQAGNFIELKPPFWAKQGSTLKTTLTPCDGGGGSPIFSSVLEPGGEELILPSGFEELHLKKHPPLAPVDYFHIGDDGLRVHVTQKGKIELLGRKQGETTWTTYHPGFETTDGHYQVHFRETVPEVVVVRFNGRLLKQLQE